MCIRYWRRADDVRAFLIGGMLATGLAFAGLGAARALNTMDGRYQLLSVAVASPVKMGSLVSVSVLRRILKDFPGHYNATVRQVDNVTPICNGGLPVPYKAMSAAALAVEAQAVTQTLDWWTAGAKPPCQQEVDRLSPGIFVLTVCIHDDTGGFMNRLWPRFVCRDSNVFEVVE